MCLTLTAPSGERIEAVLPGRTLALLVRLLEEMARGTPVTLMPMQAELTTVQAAHLLQVSRPHLIKLLDSGKIPYRKVGSPRPIRCTDLKMYMETGRAAREQVLGELAAEAQRLGLYE